MRESAKEILIHALEKALAVCRQKNCESTEKLIADLFYGEVCPVEDIANNPTEEYRALLAEIKEAREEVLQKIGSENENLLDWYSGLYLNLNFEQARQCYESGFQTMARFILSGMQ